MSYQFDVCFVACHPAAGTHFAEFQKVLVSKGKRVFSLAVDKAFEAMTDRKVIVTNFLKGITLDNAPKDELCRIAGIIEEAAPICITDVGHLLMVELHVGLQKGKVRHLAYYDNSEEWVPGGYSETAKKVIENATGVIFANANLAKEGAKLFSQKEVEIDLHGKERIALGFYPMQEVEAIRKIRGSEERQKLRKAITENEKSSIVTYVGGANEEYYQRAFPKFIECLKEAQKTEDLSNVTILFQMHPRSDKRDVQLLEELKKSESKTMPQIVFSTLKTVEAVGASDLVIYFQTSMAAAFALAGLPSMQVAKEAFADVLVRNNLTRSITKAEDFAPELKKMINNTLQADVNAVFEGVGVKTDWQERLGAMLPKNCSSAAEQDIVREGMTMKERCTAKRKMREKQACDSPSLTARSEVEVVKTEVAPV